MPWPEIVEVGAGMDFTCALCASGAVYCWGGSNRGQLGVGGREARDRPVRVHGIDDGADLSVGFAHACVVRRGGAVACWGMGDSAQLGDGTTEDRLLPVAVLDLDDAVEVAAGMGFTCARKRGGTVVCWGRNIGRNPVDPGPTRFHVPQVVEGLEDAAAIDAGDLHACALRSTGQGVCWGVSLAHSVGPAALGNHSAPVALPFETVRQISAGHEHTCALLEGGEVRCWGGNRHHELGPGEASAVPASGAVRIEGLEPVRHVAVGQRRTCVVTAGDEVRCWGGEYPSPRTVEGIGPAAQVALSPSFTGGHGCALSGSRTIWCWGQNDMGQLGRGTGGDSEGATRVPAPLSTEPVAIESHQPEGGAFFAQEVVAGYDQSCARRDGEVWCWGRAPAAKIRPATPDWRHPRRLEGIDGAVRLAAGFGFMCALVQGGAVSCWGENDLGQLGDGTTEWHPTPTAVAGVDGAVDLVADYGRACVIRADGQVWCWGERAPVAAPVGELRRFTGRVQQLALSDGHWCVLLSSGEVRCEGHNGMGQIGNGEGGCWPDPEAIPCPIPRSKCRRRQICARAEELVAVRDLRPAAQIALGSGFSCARHEDGGVSCWGKNHQGQLGRGAPAGGEETWLPSPVVGLDDAIDLQAFSGRACARTASGGALCWGHNVFGELGDRTNQDRPSPSAVFGLESVVELSAGMSHGCARTADDSIWCWGDNTHGQLGDGTTERRHAPRLVRAEP